MANIIEQYWLKDGLDTEMDDSGLITHRESCIIKYDEIVTTGPEAISSSGFEIGQEHRSNINLFLNEGIQANPIGEDTGAVWRYDLVYTTNGFNISIDGEDNNRVEVNTGSWTYSAVVEVDKETGDPIETPAGDPYDPMPEDIIAAPILIITKRENSARIDNLENVGSINRSGIRIAGLNLPKYCAMLADYQSNPVIDDRGNLTFRNTYTIKGLYKKNKSGQVIGFKQEVLARGFNEINSEGVKTEIIVKTPKDSDDLSQGYDDVPTAEPLKLSSTGSVTDTPYYQEFVIHDLYDFSNFNLPSSYPIN